MGTVYRWFRSLEDEDGLYLLPLFAEVWAQYRPGQWTDALIPNSVIFCFADQVKAEAFITATPIPDDVQMWECEGENVEKIQSFAATPNRKCISAFWEGQLPDDCISSNEHLGYFGCTSIKPIRRIR